MRLINADLLKEEFPKNSDWEYPVNTNEYVVEVIDKQPTVDAVPVIRCEKCKYKRIENLVWRCPFGLPAGASFYCGYGAWKEE